MGRKKIGADKGTLEKYFIAEGLSVKEIAMVYSCSEAYIRKKLYEFSLMPKNPIRKKKHEDETEIGIKEIREILNIHPGDWISTEDGEKQAAACYPYHVVTEDGSSYQLSELYMIKCRKDGIGFWRKETA